MEFQSTKRFSEELLNLVANSETSKELGEKVTSEYKVLKQELENEILEKLNSAKVNHEKTLSSIEEERIQGIKKNDDIFNALSEEEKLEKAHIEEHDNAIKGVNIVAKRARIKENNDYDLLENPHLLHGRTLPPLLSRPSTAFGPTRHLPHRQYRHEQPHRSSAAPDRPSVVHHCRPSDSMILARRRTGLKGRVMY